MFTQVHTYMYSTEDKKIHDTKMSVQRSYPLSFIFRLLNYYVWSFFQHFLFYERLRVSSNTESNSIFSFIKNCSFKLTIKLYNFTSANKHTQLSPSCAQEIMYVSLANWGNRCHLTPHKQSRSLTRLAITNLLGPFM